MLYLTLAVCAVLAAAVVLRYDLYEREPLPMLVLAALLGFGAMHLMGYAEPWTLDLFGPPPRPDALVALVAATHEELARLVVVGGLALLLPRQVNDPMDGLIYGSIVGLGMAVEESMFYLRLYLVAPSHLPPAEIIRLCGHLVMGGITGFAVGMARFRQRGWVRALIACVGASMLLHGLWDVTAFAAADRGAMTPGLTVAAVAIMLGGMALYGALVRVASRWSAQRFAGGRLRRPWGWWWKSARG